MGVNCLPGLALSLHPPNLGLPSSWDYMCEPLMPGFNLIFFNAIQSCRHEAISSPNLPAFMLLTQVQGLFAILFLFFR
jgi:hypothetical protein